MNSTAQDIKDILVADGIGTFGTDLFVSLEPSSPDACVTVFDSGGFDSEANYVYDRPTVMVRIRGDVFGYQAAWTKAESVKNSLHGLTNETHNGTRYVGIWCVGDIGFLEYDGENRPIFSVNFRVHRTA